MSEYDFLLWLQSLIKTCLDGVKRIYFLGNALFTRISFIIMSFPHMWNLWTTLCYVYPSILFS